MTIDELAAKAGTTVRNVRSYRSKGLLDPPQVVGRVGYYDENHLQRIELILRLQAKGHSLAGIARLLEAWRDGKTLLHVLGITQAFYKPWTEGPTPTTVEQVETDLPGLLGDEELRERAVGVGLLLERDDGLFVGHSSVYEFAQTAILGGLELREILTHTEHLQRASQAIGTYMVGNFMRIIWEPWERDGRPLNRLPWLADLVIRLRKISPDMIASFVVQKIEDDIRDTTARFFGRTPQDEELRS